MSDPDLIYDWRTGDLPCSRAWDAEGNEITGPVFRINCDTGECWRYKEPLRVASDGQSIISERFTVPAPVTVQLGPPRAGGHDSSGHTRIC